MHFEALHCVNLQSDETENLTIAGMCKLIEYLLSSHKVKRHIFSLKDMEWFISMFGTLSNNFPLCIFFVHLLIDKAERKCHSLHLSNGLSTCGYFRDIQLWSTV